MSGQRRSSRVMRSVILPGFDETVCKQARRSGRVGSGRVGSGGADGRFPDKVKIFSMEINLLGGAGVMLMSEGGKGVVQTCRPVFRALDLVSDNEFCTRRFLVIDKC